MAIDNTAILAFASEFLEAGEGAMDAIRVHEFKLDGDEHDDYATDLLHQEFKQDFDEATQVLTRAYGPPARNGASDNDAIPMTGIKAFVLWTTGSQALFLAISHEDRGAPILLMLGCAI
ncbi:MAG: hypothetical protein AAGA25_16505 [Planctomycetota bacterium]